MPGLVRIILAVSVAAVPVMGAAAPRTIADCETIEAADAYNQCLALFGPPGRSLRLSPVDARNETGDSVAATPRRVVKNKNARLVRKSARRASASREHGRERMVFSVVSGQSTER